MKTPVKVLYINGNIMKRGGIEACMMNYFRHIDHSKVHIDFLVHGYEKGVYDDEIIATGSKIFHVPTKSKHPIAYQKELKRLFKSEHFDIVHSHLDAMSGWVLKIAKECGVPVRIAHSHNTDHLTTNFLKRIVNEYAKKQITKQATDLFACSEAAGKWLFGNDSEFRILNNAIEVDRFTFEVEKRENIRKQFGWEDKFVIGHVGRFDYQKNQEFLITILPEILLKRPNIQMVFIGTGEDIGKIKALAKKTEVLNICTFLENRADVADLYNAFDIFVLPSRFEGLAVVAIEAQTNGLTCLFSDNITEEVVICDNVHMLSLNHRKKWIDFLVHYQGERNINNINKIKEAGYSIQEKAKELELYYVEKRNG